MTLNTIINKFEGVKQTARGFLVLCPAHADSNPSLSIKETHDGTLLIHCWAGCRTVNILTAVGLQLRDLFPNRHPWDYCSPQPKAVVRRMDHNAIVFKLKFHADCLTLRAESVLRAAQGLRSWEWTDEERDNALRSVNRAYTDLERSDLLRNVAFGIRLGTKPEWCALLNEETTFAA